MTIDDLTVPPAALSLEDFLTEWTWLTGDDASLVMVTRFGDAFVQQPDKTVHYLDTTGGTFTQVAENGLEFQQMLSDRDFVMQCFNVEAYVELQNAGLQPVDGQCYSHVTPLVLGGEDTVDNTEVTNVAVHVCLMGQIHARVQDVSEGTPVGDAEVS